MTLVRTDAIGPVREGSPRQGRVARPIPQGSPRIGRTARMPRYRGVGVFTGMPGSGKTYSLAEKGAKGLARGWPVYSNKGFELAGSTIFESFSDFCDIPSGCNYERHREMYDDDGVCLAHGVRGTHPVIVCWDEAPVYFNARRWQSFHDGTFVRLTQVRKDGLWLYYSAIDMSFVDVTLRRLTFWETQCRSITSTLLYRQTFGHPELRKKEDRPRDRHLYRVRESVAALYDTTSKVEVFTDARPERPETDGPPSPRAGRARSGRAIEGQTVRNGAVRGAVSRDSGSTTSARGAAEWQR